MKTIHIVFVAAAFAFADGYLINVPIGPAVNRIAPVGWVHVQKLLLPLFENVCEKSLDPVVVRLSNEFLSSSESADYLKLGVFEDFQTLVMSNSLLPKGEIFTELNKNHLNELKIIYSVLFHAKTFDTFYKAACWARQNLNCGIFTDALYLTVIFRKDTENIFLAPPYEILPNYFIQKDYILKASALIRGERSSDFDGVREEGNSYVLDVNFTSIFDASDTLAYFHEDIGLNSFYFLEKLKNLRRLLDPVSNCDNEWGQHLYHIRKQLVNRYDLERYSNGLPELEPLKWEDIRELVYDPNLVYSNGNDFGSINYVNENTTLLSILKNIETNITAAVVHMRDGGYNKAEILNHLMDILINSENSYENLALQILSNVGSVTGSYSALCHYMTIVRDPMFWKLNKKIVEMVDNALKMLPVYSKNQLYFPGVEVVNIDGKKLMTSFENIEVDVTDALQTQDNKTNFLIKINQQILSMKPFSFKINVSSLVNQRALVKLFIGPKILPGQFIENKNHFMLLDCFETNLKIGNNLITKSSNEMNNLSQDFISLNTVNKYLLDAEFGVNVVSPRLVHSQYKFPSRLLLPKGSTDGLPFQIFVFIAPFVKANVVGSQINFESNSDTILSPGYPLDLNIDIQNLFNLPNVLVKDITITHKCEIRTNTYNTGTSNKEWQNNGYQASGEYSRNIPLSAKPVYNKGNFDYKSKKDQYGKKRNYPAALDGGKKDDVNLFDTNTDAVITNNIEHTNVKNDFDFDKLNDLQNEINNAMNLDKINKNTISSNDDDVRAKYIYTTEENIKRKDLYKTTPGISNGTFYNLFNYSIPVITQTKAEVFY